MNTNNIAILYDGKLKAKKEKDSLLIIEFSTQENLTV